MRQDGTFTGLASIPFDSLLQLFAPLLLIASMSWNQFPQEMLAEICRYACTDGGRTGCSLALTSRYMRETSKPYRFQSISIQGSFQAIALYRTLSETPAAERRVVSLSIVSDPEPSPFRPASPYQHLRGTVDAPRTPIQKLLTIAKKHIPCFAMPVERQERDGLGLAVVTNLSMTSDLLYASHYIILWSDTTLEYLSFGSLRKLLGWPWQQIGILHGPKLANLQILTIRPTLSVLHFTRMCRDTEILSIRYLDLVGLHSGESESVAINLFDCINSLAPNLKYLRIPTKVAMELAHRGREWRWDSASGSGGVAEARLSRGIERVFIQICGEEPIPNASDLDFAEWGLTMHAIQTIESMDERVQVVLWEQFNLGIIELVTTHYNHN
ncbi:hypothetical protein HWV62_8038 [Athelia sp. TMB]|nr:hypothetical protein HWV62_8038 [Athelia sp. TMB]